ncbi:NAD(+) diphosphatase [Parahaliea aestuarii]|uniref:NAD(+) diphosphatase n=1 Tax=Parahaliea aestuarii TaxID=1852021 RepID=A0A5C8ZRN8_9GAMM|nr:NAD(+) diphosphatase [Parahaliea aestuarii]TXS91158.1 NAD(+) diphosphatase [Parahaliea aestuarii]
MFRLDNHPPVNRGRVLHIVFQDGELLSDLRSPQACLLGEDELYDNGWVILREQFVGYWGEQPCFAVEIDSGHSPDPMRFQRGSLYSILGRVEDPLFAMAGRAAQLLNWEKDHQFCGRCGSPMELDSAERAMRCRPCRTINYPRISPCIITLVTRGEELLLARNANFPRAMYSTLAGFIEAGESAEDTLHREVKEEVGIDVHNLQYFNSQPWPFPSQLMLGFYAEYAGGEIVCDPAEIADARWFHYTDLPQVPPPSSVAGQLIRHYVQSLN